MANVYDALMAAANVVASRKKKEEEAAIAGAMKGISSPAKQTVTGSNNGAAGGAMLGVSQPYRQAYVDAVSTLKNRLSSPSVSPSPVLAMAPGTAPSATPEMLDAMRKRDPGEPILSQPAGMQITEKRDPMAIYDKYVANPGLGLDGWDRSNKYDDMVAAGMPAQDAYAMRQQDYNDLLKQQGDLDAARQQLLDSGVVQEGDDVLKRMADHSTQMEKRTGQMAMDMIDQNQDFAEVAGNVDLAWPENYSYMTGNGVDNAYAAIADPNKFLANVERANLLRNLPMMGQGPMVSTPMELPREYNIAMSMSDAEKDRYKYLYASDPVKATEYFYGLEPTINQRRTQEMNQQLYEMGRGSTGGAIGATALSILAGPAKTKGYMKSFANMLTGQETDPYDPAFLASHASSSASGGARERAVNAFKDENGQDTFLSKAAGFGYDLVQNLGSNALNLLLGTGGWGTLLMMGSQSAGDAAMDAALRSDGDTKKAFLYGSMSGLMEIATEKIPLDKLENMLSGKSKGLRALLAQAFTEAPGEMASTAGQEAFDRIILGAQSNYETNVRKLMAGDPENGIAPMDEASARKEATRQFLDEVIYSGLLGFGSGVVSGGGAQMTNRLLGNTPAAQQEAQKPAQEKAVKQKLDEAADSVIALREAEKPAPVEMEKTGDVQSFDKPIQAMLNTEEGGAASAVQVTGIENGPDGKAQLRIVSENGIEERVGLDEVTLADEGMQDLLTDKAVQSMDADTLRGYIKDYNPDIATAPEYAKAYTGVYRRAATGMDYSTAVDGSEYAMRFLTAEAKRNAFEAGHAVSEAQAEKAKPKTTGGVVRAFSDATWKSMDRSTRRQAAAQMEVLNAIGQRFGRNIRVVDSINADGKRANGMYNQKTGEITVALDADNNAYAYVAMHELTHSIRTEHQGSWDTFSGIVRDALSASGQDVDALVQYQMDRFGLDKDAAWEEVVCNTAPAMLQDEAVLTDLYNRDRTLFERVMEWVKNLIDDIRKAGVTLSERSQSWKQMDALKDDRESLQKLYDAMKGIFDGDGNELSGVEVIDGSAVKYSLSSWTEEEKEKVQKALVKAGYDRADAQKWIEDVNSVSAIVESDKARLDFDADPDQVMLKNNQEYVKTLDASTLCAKRLLYQGTFNAIQHRLPNTVITSDLLLDLLNKMKEKGYETPCGICYVESRRRHLGKFAEQWLHGRPADKEQKAWAPYNGEYIPSLDELTTTDGLARLKEEHPQTYNDFVAKMASLGSSNPKIVELRTDYRGDIRKLSKASAEKISRIGGLRVQSFSDFETPHLLDMMQAVLDMTSKGLTSQAYTKVPNFAWVFGDTGIKINLSLIAEGNGIDENGNLIFSSAEGMDFDEAMRLRERYSQNVGTIVVGANDAHIRAAMADPRIDFIIPFHRSGWGQNELKKVGVLQEYTDYQATQNERTIKGYKKNGTPDYGKPEGGNFYPIDYWDYSKTGDQNAETYLRLCEEDGRVPKFDQFLEKDADGHWKAPSGYWKMLIDFKMYDNDGNGAPQQQVMPHFNMEEAERVLAEYKGGANSLPVAQDIVDEFVAELEKEDTLTKYSLSDYDENVQESDKLLEEMLTMTAAHRMTDGEAMRIASRAKKAAQSSMDTKELAGKIKRVFDYAERSGRNKKLDMPGFNAELLGLAEELLATSRTLDTEHEKAVQPVRDYLRKAEIALTDDQRQEAVKLAGTYNDFRRQVFGRVKLRQTGQSLSDVWGELSRMNPEMFPSGASEQEMVRDLVNAVDMMAPIYHDLSGMNEAENVQRVAAEIGNLYMSLSGVQLAAAEYKEFGMKLRDYRQVNERFTAEHKKLFKRAMAKVNAEAQAAVDDAKAYVAAMQLKNLEWRETYRDKLKDVSRKQRYRAQITRMTNELVKRMEKPTDKKHVKAYLEKDLMAFLSSLDLGRRSKETRSLGDRIRTLADRFANAQSDSENGSGQYMIDPELIADMRTMADEMSALNSMAALNADQMRDMRDMVKAATHVVNAADYMFAMGKKTETSEVAERSIMEMSRKKDKTVRQGFAGKIDEMLSNGMLDSFRFFDRLGESAREVFTGIRKGFDRKVEKVSDALDYVQRVTKGFGKDLFRGDKAEKTTYKVSGGEISLTKAQVMELYCLSKRPQAQKHLYGGGIRTQDNANAVTLNEADVQQICSSLTDEEVKMAEKLQSYLVKECAVWGNETSMLLYGYKKFTEENYYPIRVDRNKVQQMQTDKGQDENLYAILHMGMTKSTNDLANNALIVGDIFDTFSRHVDNMSTYNAYAAPIADMLRWYNWNPVDGGDGTKTMLEKKFGKAGRDYIPTLIRDLNGQVSKSYSPGIVEEMTRRAKSASVGANIRVAIQQPTAIARALDMMNPKYILKGMTMNPKAMKKAIDLAQKYCPIAKWKSLGFYETHIGKGLRTLMFGGQTALENLTDKSMALAGKMDEVTWGALWRACEAETSELRPDLTGAELYRETGKRLGEIIDYTQVVDTPLHRSQLMRSKDYVAQMSTAFMSESTKTYNMLEAAIARWAENRKDPVARAKVARALLVYAGTAALNAAFQSVWDAVRDSGTEKDFLEKILGKYMENLSDNLNPMGMIPVVSQVMDVLDGYDPSRMDMQAVQKVVQIGDQLKKANEGKSNWTAAKWIQNVSNALSYMTGVPAGNLVRDLMAIYNTTSMALGGQPIAMTTTSTMTAETQKSLYGALVSGNAKKWNRMIESMKDKSAADIDASLAKQMAEEDERIALAYEAKAAGNGPEALRIRKEIVDELSGFSMLDEKRLTEIVDKAVLTYGSSVNPEKEKEEEEVKPLSAKLFRTEDGKNAVLGVAEGRMSVADAKLILSELAADSTAKDPEKSVRSTVLAEVKKDWTAAMKAGDDQKARRLEHAMVEVLGVPEDDPQKWRMDMNADDLRTEVKTGDKAKASKTVQKMRDEGLSDSDIKARLSPFKAEYISMVDSGDRQGAENLKRMLIGLGLEGKNGKDLYTDETFEAWTED